MRGWHRAVALAAAALASTPAWASDPGVPRGLPEPVIGSLPGPADTGKPLIFSPEPARPAAPAGCVPALPCGSQLLGAVRRNGAVVIEVPAWRW